MRLVYRHFPLISIHPNAQIASEAAEAAGAQDKFWEMHEILYTQQQAWSQLGETEIIDQLVEYAEEIGLDDVDQFRDDLENDSYAEDVLADYEAAVAANLTGTPSFVINGVDYPTNAFGLSYEGLDIFIQLMKLRKNQWYDGPEQVIEADKEYIATIKTEKGDIVIELFNNTAPVNVNSFVFLAQEGWYEETTFHRVLPDFVAQGGDPTGTGVGFPGYRCSDEISPARAFDEAGLVSLANSGPDTNGGQFFITYTAVPQLNEGFTMLGRVIEGQSVVENLEPRNPQEDVDAPPGDKILEVIVEEKE